MSKEQLPLSHDVTAGQLSVCQTFTERRYKALMTEAGYDELQADAAAELVQRNIERHRDVAILHALPDFLLKLHESPDAERITAAQGVVRFVSHILSHGGMPYYFMDKTLRKIQERDPAKEEAIASLGHFAVCPAVTPDNQPTYDLASQLFEVLSPLPERPHHPEAVHGSLVHFIQQPHEYMSGWELARDLIHDRNLGRASLDDDRADILQQISWHANDVTEGKKHLAKLGIPDTMMQQLALLNTGRREDGPVYDALFNALLLEHKGEAVVRTPVLRSFLGLYLGMHTELVLVPRHFEAIEEVLQSAGSPEEEQA